MTLPLKRHKDKPWEWVDSKCFAKEFHPESSKLPDCDGVMELKDVKLMGGSFETGSEEGHIYHKHSPGYLEKIWVCNVCGFIFPE